MARERRGKRRFGKIAFDNLHDLYLSPNIIGVLKCRMGGAFCTYGREVKWLQGFGVGT